MIVNIDSTFPCGLVDISLSDFDEHDAEQILRIVKVDNSNELHISVEIDNGETQNIYKKLTK